MDRSLKRMQRARRLMIFGVMIILSTLAPCVADFIPVNTEKKGLFYLFMPGQVVVIDPVSQIIVKSIRNLNGSFAAIPNTCPGDTYQGTWNAMTLGLDQQTIFATLSYAQSEISGLSDSVLVLNTTSQEIEAKFPVKALPTHIKYLPNQEGIWLYTESNGSLTAFSAFPPYNEIINDLQPRYGGIAGHSEILVDSAMGGKAYRTTDDYSGIYVYDLQSFSVNIPFIDFSNYSIIKTPGMVAEPITCPGTKKAVYSSVSRRAFISCTLNNPAQLNQGLVEVDINSNIPVNTWSFTAEEFFITPDESFLLCVDSANDQIHVLEFQAGFGNTKPGARQWPSFAFRKGTHPSSIVFYPYKKYYKAFVSLLRAKSTAVIDFNIVFTHNCFTDVADPTINFCSSATMDSSISFLQSGYHVQPGVVNTITPTRPIAVGHRFVCVAADFDASLRCFNQFNTNLTKSYKGLTGIQHIMFVEGEFDGNETLLDEVDTSFNCSFVQGYPPPPDIVSLLHTSSAPSYSLSEPQAPGSSVSKGMILHRVPPLLLSSLVFFAFLLVGRDI